MLIVHRLLKQHLLHLADGALQHLLMQLLVHLRQTRCTLALNCLVHLLQHFGSRGSFTLRIREDVHFRKAALLGKFQSSRKILLGFAGEAHDNVRSNCHIGHLRTNFVHQLRKTLGIVRTVHSAQNLVAAALQRQMQVTLQARFLGHQLQQARFHLHRFQRTEAHTLHALNAQRCLYCVIQSNVLAFLRQLLAVAAKVNADEHNFFVACGNQLANLLADAVQAAAAQRTAGKGNNAIGAILVAALLNFEEGAGFIGFRADAKLFELSIHSHLLHVVQNLRTLVLQCFFDQLYNAAALLIADDYINTFDSTNLLGRSLRIATGNNHQRKRIVTHSAIDNLARFALTGIGNNAGIN